MTPGLPAQSVEVDRVGGDAVVVEMGRHPVDLKPATLAVRHTPDRGPDDARKLVLDTRRILAFEVEGGTEAGIRVMNALRLCSLAENLGAAETLVTHPASMTHAAVPAEQRERTGITDGLVRLSVGLEDTADLIADHPNWTPDMVKGALVNTATQLSGGANEVNAWAADQAGSGQLSANQGLTPNTLIDPDKTTTCTDGAVKPAGKDSSLTTWKGDQWKLGGGTTWGWYAYDPKLNLVYYGSGNPGTWNPAQRPGDNKWSMTIWARDLDTGMAKWVFQMTPHDEWDFDGVNEMVLLDLNKGGKSVPALAHFDRNGFGYTLNRATGELMVADYARRYGGGGACTVLGCPDIKAHAPYAALANGVFAHAFEHDSFRDPSAGAHQGATIFPAVLAACEETGADGKTALAAFVAGCEVMLRIGNAAHHSATISWSFSGLLAARSLAWVKSLSRL